MPSRARRLRSEQRQQQQRLAIPAPLSASPQGSTGPSESRPASRAGSRATSAAAAAAPRMIIRPHASESVEPGLGEGQSPRPEGLDGAEQEEGDNDDEEEEEEDEAEDVGLSMSRPAIDATRQRIAHEKELMAALLPQFSTEQLDRWESFRRAGLQRHLVRRYLAARLATSVGPNVALALSGAAKIFVGQIVEFGPFLFSSFILPNARSSRL